MNENIIENPSDISFNSELSTSELEISQDEICEESIINKDKQVSLVINSISSTLEKLINNEKQKKDTDLKIEETKKIYNTIMILKELDQDVNEALIILNNQIEEIIKIGKEKYNLSNEEIEKLLYPIELSNKKTSKSK